MIVSYILKRLAQLLAWILTICLSVGGFLWKRMFYVILAILLYTYVIVTTSCHGDTREITNNSHTSKYQLPYDVHTFNFDEHVPRSIYDGLASVITADYSQKLSDYLSSRTDLRLTFEEQIELYRPSVARALREEFTEVSSQYTKSLQLLLNELLPFAGLDGLDFNVYLVEYSSGQPYVSASTYPGAIFFGVGLLDLFLQKTNSPKSACIFVLSHELGHLIQGGFEEYAQEQNFIDSAGMKYGKLGRQIVKGLINVTQDAFQQRDEVISDMLALAIVNSSKYDALTSLQGMRVMAMLAEENEYYTSGFAKSHGLMTQRVAALSDYLLRYQVH